MTLSAFALTGVGHVVMFKMASEGNVEFFAYDGIDVVRVADVLKVEHAEHIAVICERQRGHVQLLGPCDERIKF